MNERDNWNIAHDDFIKNQKPIDMESGTAKLIKKVLNKYFGNRRVRILEIGCGIGRYSALLYKLGCDLVCIDFNDKMIETTKEILYKEMYNDDRMIKPTFDVYKMSLHKSKDDWTRLKQKFGQFDLVFSNAVIQHNSHTVKPIIFEGIESLLKTGGYLYMNENTIGEKELEYYKNNNIMVKEYKDYGKTDWNPCLETGFSFTKKGWILFANTYGLNFVESPQHCYYIFQKSD